MRSEGKRGTCKECARRSENALLESGGPGQQRSFLQPGLNPQSSDYFMYSHFCLCFRSCWPHRSFLTTLVSCFSLFSASIWGCFPPSFSICLFPFVHFLTISTPSHGILPLSPLFHLSPLCLPLCHDLPLHSSSISRLKLSGLNCPSLDLRVCLKMQYIFEFIKFCAPKFHILPPPRKLQLGIFAVLPFLWEDLEVVVIVRGMHLSSQLKHINHPTALPLFKVKWHLSPCLLVYYIFALIPSLRGFCRWLFVHIKWSLSPRPC